MPETYRSAHTGSIADLMRQQGQVRARQAATVGQAQAQQAAASGQVWGQAIQNIGQGVSGTLADFARQQEQAPVMALRQKQVEQLSAELAAMDTASAQKKIGELAQMVKASGYDPSAAEPVFSAIAKLSPDYAEPLQRSLMEPALLRQVTDTLISQTPGYKAQEGFSLSEGQTRFGPDGTQIASVAKSAPVVPPPQPFTLTPGSKRFNPDGTVAAEVPAAERPEPNVTESQLAMMAAQGNAQAAKALQQLRSLRAPQAEKNPIPIVGEDGQSIYVLPNEAVGKRVPTTRENPTEDERKSAGFYQRMNDAIRVMDEVEGALTPQDIYQIQSLPQEDLMGLVNRGKMSEPAKRYIRAMMQFTEARLRADSGAAIGKDEYANDRQMYAKQYGETPQLNTDRRGARTIALEGLKTRGGRAVQKPSGGGKVKMQAPDGSMKEVDSSQVEHYKSLGAKVVGG